MKKVSSHGNLACPPTPSTIDQTEKFLIQTEEPLIQITELGEFRVYEHNFCDSDLQGLKLRKRIQDPEYNIAWLSNEQHTQYLVPPSFDTRETENKLTAKQTVYAYLIVLSIYFLWAVSLYLLKSLTIDSSTTQNQKAVPKIQVVLKTQLAQKPETTQENTIEVEEQTPSTPIKKDQNEIQPLSTKKAAKATNPQTPTSKPKITKEDKPSVLPHILNVLDNLGKPTNEEPSLTELFNPSEEVDGVPLKDPSLVFDSHLRHKLQSYEIQKINRRRVDIPEEHYRDVYGTDFYRTGNSCTKVINDPAIGKMYFPIACPRSTTIYTQFGNRITEEQETPFKENATTEKGFVTNGVGFEIKF